jgi:PIN domain nuclease of toxin-antitoxin system
VERAQVILLDTHVLLWLAIEPKRLTAPAKHAIRSATRSGGLAIAAITLWEIAMLFARGRVRARGTVEASVRLVVDSTGVLVRDLSVGVAALAVQLNADFPDDPADRLIAATAIDEGLALVTRDERISRSGLVKTIW